MQHYDLTLIHVSMLFYVDGQRKFRWWQFGSVKRSRFSINPLVQPLDFVKYQPVSLDVLPSHFPRYKLPSAPLIEFLGAFKSTKKTLAFWPFLRKKRNRKEPISSFQIQQVHTLFSSKKKIGFRPQEASTTSERYHRSVVQQALR